MNSKRFLMAWVPIVIALMAAPATADQFFFSTGSPDGLIATASRPSSPGKIEIESADDFILTTATRLTSATFTGLLPTGGSLSDVEDVRIEIYRVFPKDSGIPSGNVPTRNNSPSDVVFDDRSASGGNLGFTIGVLSPSFTASNSVLNGIHPLPGQHTGGEGAVTGQEVQFNVVFGTPLTLPADHYFFVPQVQLANGDFFWLSAPKPIVAPGTPFLPDLQSWIRNEDLSPDWLRIGGDIVGGTAYNASFSLSGRTVPEPASLAILATGGVMLFGWHRRRRNRKS
jgi:hypothetical protein